MKNLLLILLFISTTFVHSQLVPAKEEWNKLTVDRRQFAPAQPAEGGIQSQVGFTRELLQVSWRPGDPIDVYIVRPENVKKPPVVLFLYSWPDDTNRFKSDAWCRTITQHGFAAVGFTSALTGDRYHDRPWKETFLTELPEALSETVHDIQLMLDYLGTRQDLDATRTGIFGQGSGGTIALLAASVDPRLLAVDVIDPWGDWPVWFASSPIVDEAKRSDLLMPKFINAIAPLDTAVILPKLYGRTLRLQQTSINPSTPPQAAQKMKSALPSTALYLFYPSEAAYRNDAMKDGAILDWIQTKLSASQTPMSLF